jgi:hypothetical protein
MDIHTVVFSLASAENSLVVMGESNKVNTIPLAIVGVYLPIFSIKHLTRSSLLPSLQIVERHRVIFAASDQVLSVV